MRVGVTGQIRKEDLAKAGGELPAWVDLLIDPINDFMEKMSKVLNNRITFADNIQCDLKTQTFTSGTALSIAVRNNLRVLGIIPLDALSKQIESYGITRNSDATLSVTFSFVGAGSGQVTFAILYS